MENTGILTTDAHNSRRKIQESLEIREEKPLNQVTGYKLPSIYQTIIAPHEAKRHTSLQNHHMQEIDTTPVKKMSTMNLKAKKTA